MSVSSLREASLLVRAHELKHRIVASSTPTKPIFSLSRNHLPKQFVVRASTIFLSAQIEEIGHHSRKLLSPMRFVGYSSVSETRGHPH